ncbi:MAG: CPBP family glutamic-type intramembrane protease [Promethearchaeota archaeon]
MEGIHTSSDQIFYCPVCNRISELQYNPRFCPGCGYPFPRDENQQLIIRHTHFASRENIDTYLDKQLLEKRKFRPKKWNVWAGFLLPLVTYLIMLLIGVIILELIKLFTSGIITSTVQTIIIGFTSLLYFFTPIFWISRYFSGKLTFSQKLAELGLPLKQFSKSEFTREIILGILIGLGMVILGFILQFLSAWFTNSIFGIDIFYIISRLGDSQFLAPNPDNIWDLLAFILKMLLFVGVPEEIMFRGFVQRSFNAKMTRSASILLTATYFSIYHIFLFILMPPIFVFLLPVYLGISLVLGILRNWRGNVISCVAAHIIYNITQAIILYLIFL